MGKKNYNLQLFTDGGGAGGAAQGEASGNAGMQANTQGAAHNASYSYEQAEQIAEARAARATKEALAEYFSSRGMSEDEANTAFADYKAKKAANRTDVAAIEKQRDEALAKVAEMQNLNYLRDKGVKADDLDYVMFKVGKQVDDKTDFKKAADAYLKGNPRFTGQGFKVVSTGTPDGGTGTGQTASDTINASIRSAFGR